MQAIQSAPSLNLSGLTVDECLQFLNLNGNKPSSQSLISLQEEMLTVIRANFVQKWIKNRYTIEYPQKLYTPAIHDCVLAEIYRQNRANDIYYIESAKISLLLSEDKVPLLGIGRALGIITDDDSTIKLDTPIISLDPLNRNLLNRPDDWFEELRERCVRVLTAAGKVERTLFSDKRAQIWDYPFPKKYCPENESKIIAKFSQPLSIYQEIKYTKHTTEYILTQLPNGVKKGDVLRDPDSKKIFILGNEKIYSPIRDLRHDGDQMAPNVFSFPEFPIGYWSGIIPGQKSWMGLLSSFSDQIWSNLRGPYRGEFRSYFVFDGLRYNIAISESDDIDTLLSAKVKLSLRSDGYYHVY